MLPPDSAQHPASDGGVPARFVRDATPPRRRGRTRLAIAAGLVLAVVAGLAWWQQSRVLGVAARWWLARVAAREAASGTLAQRRGIVTNLHRQLLLAPPADAHVPELFELLTQLSSKVATGEVSLPWAAHVYTSYLRDLVRDRPTGEPRRSPDGVRLEIARVQEFYTIRERPDVPGITVGDVLGTGDDVITLDEIEEADRTGQAIDLRKRGAR